MTLATRKALDALNELGIMLDSRSDLHDKPITTRQAVATLLELIEEDFIPQAALYEKDFLRQGHLDLHDMDAQSLWRETKRAEWRTVECAERTGWVAERYAACLAEAKRRAAAEKGRKG
jgi:hypothetical protein